MAEKSGVLRSTPLALLRRHAGANSSGSSSNAAGGGGGSSSSSGSEPDLLSGVPFRVSASASAGKEQVLVQVRGVCVARATRGSRGARQRVRRRAPRGACAGRGTTVR
jgi:hypothetical protein